MKFISVKGYDNFEDMGLGIDVILTLPSGSILTGQEKALSHQFEHHNPQVTIWEP